MARVADRAMGRLFTPIRWRLVAWTVLVLTLILLVLGAAVYFAVSRSLLEAVDRNLVGQSEQTERLRPPPGARVPRPGSEPFAPEGYRGGVFYLVVGPEGRVVVNPQQVDLAGVEVPRPAAREPVFATVSIDGQATRLFVRPAPRSPPGTVLVVGQSLAPEERALHTLLLVLAAGGGLGLVFSLIGGWVLAGRALVPIQQAFRRQQEFVADASHELRTPLTVLRSATDLLNQHRAEPLERNGALFDDIRHEIARLERLAGDLLTLARSDVGDLELAVAPIDLDALAREVVRRTDPLARERGISLEFDAAGGSPTIEVDPDRLQQVLLILLDNALKHTPRGGRVTVQVQRQGADLLLRVIDTGAGIAPEHLPRVFDRFYRADRARTRDRGGSGLGLAIAKLLVEAHGGALSLASTPGVGTRATVRLRPAPRGATGAPFGGLRAELGRGAER